MYFLIFTAIPERGTQEHAKCAGADLACWVNVDDRKTAEEKAQLAISERGWKIVRLELAHPLTREKAERSTGLQYFEQALKEDLVLVFMTSPANGTK